MIGAILGDVIGSVYENHNTKTTDFPLFSRFSRFTDDTVLTVATADAILNRKTHSNRYADALHARKLFASKYKEYGRRFPEAGYGQMFREWLKSDSSAGYGSYGNGSAMRVSPIGFAYETIEEVLKEARISALPTHNHKQGIEGAQAAASSIFFARTGQSKEFIQKYVEQKFKYDLHRRLDEIRPTYKFDSSCRGSVPYAMIAFLESTDYEDAIRKAISIGGDSDTIACIAGGIAQAYYKHIPGELVVQARLLLDWGLKQVIGKFEEKYEVVY